MNHSLTADKLRQKIKLIESQLTQATADTNIYGLCEQLETLQTQLQKSLEARNSECLQEFNRLKFRQLKKRTIVAPRPVNRQRSRRKRARSTPGKTSPPEADHDAEPPIASHYFRLINAWGV